MLSDRDLQKLALTHEFITPMDPNDFEGATINLRIGQTIRKYISDDYLDIDFTENDFFLEPGQSVLIRTYECINVPEMLSTRIYERYSIKSLGLMIGPAYYLNPVYREKYRSSGCKALRFPNLQMELPISFVKNRIYPLKREVIDHVVV